jgi:hypothetical protein
MADPMSIAAAVSTILESVEGPDVRLVSDDGSVWKLGTPGLFAGSWRRHATPECP